MAGKKYPRLGELIDKAVRMIAAHQGWTMMGTHGDLAKELGVSSDAIHNWRQGRNRPDDEILIKFMRLAARWGKMDRNWGSQVLHQIQHPAPDMVLDSIWPRDKSGAGEVPHNLPRPYHWSVGLVGRRKEVQEIINRLHPDARDWIVPLEGIGGVGKTALALEVAWHYVDNYRSIPINERFEAIIWASAKRSQLSTKGIEPNFPGLSNLTDLYRCIANVLRHPIILSVTPDKQLEAVEEVLRQRRVLMILDNLESVDDPAIFSFLRRLPKPSKAIATMRFHEDMPYPIRLRELSSEAAHELALLEARARGIQLSEGQIESLLNHTTGLPLAIWWAIGLMSKKGHLEWPEDEKDDLLQFIFHEAVSLLKENQPDAYHLLLAFSFFPSPVPQPALAQSAGVNDKTAEIALNYLVSLNLVNRTESLTRYAVLPITRDYALAELSAMPEWEREASQRWIEYYAELTREANQSRDNLKRLEYELENIWAVIRWLDSQLDSQEEMQRLANFVTNVYYFLYQEGYWDKLQPLFEKCMTWAIKEKNTRTAAKLLTLTYIAEEKDMAKEWLDELEALAKDPKHELLLAHVNLEKGRLLYNEDKFEIGIICLKAALEVFTTRPDQLKRTVETLNRLGHAYRRHLASSSDEPDKQEFYIQALNYYSQAKDLAATCTDQAWRKGTEVLIMLSIGVVHYLAGKLEKARDTIEPILNELPRLRSRATALITLAVVQHHLGNVERAGELGRQGEELIARLKLTRPIHFADNEWREIRGEYGFADKAIGA